jgi:peptidoglycan/LPS O-acetylase OafA/YrhL
LDLLRILSAQLVLIGHCRSFLGLQEWAHALQAPYVQSLAVSVLFILSGFLTIYSAKNKPTSYGFKDFFVNRFIRIYGVYLPALVFVFGIDKLILSIGLSPFINSAAQTRNTFIANVLMLQDFPYFTNLRVFTKTTYGSALQFWTLPIEWFMYMLFGFFFYRLYRKKMIHRIPLIGIALFCAIVPFANFVFGRGNGLSFTWLVGVLIYYAYTHLKERPIAKSTVLWVTIVAFFAGILRIIAVKRTTDFDYDPIYTLGMSLAILGGLLLTARSKKEHLAISKPVKLIAGYSYSLYVTHYSVLILMNALLQKIMNPLLVSVIEFVVCNLVAYAFSLIFEKHLPTWLLSLWGKYRNRTSVVPIT